MHVLQTIDLKKYYGSEPNITRALDGVSLLVEQGEFVAVVGTSGSGKSTLLGMMGGLDTPTSGSVIVRGDRITSATCYLPLSDNMQISKALGTRHRAALGMSEVSDAMILVVSEETGYVSMAMDGQLVRNVTPEYLREKLGQIQDRLSDGKKFAVRKGRKKNEV